MCFQIDKRSILARLRGQRRFASRRKFARRNRVRIRFKCFFLRRLGRFFRFVCLHKRGILWNERHRRKIDKSQLDRLVLDRESWRENSAEDSQQKRNNQVNENRREQRPQNRSSVGLVIDRSVARLGEHDVSRRHAERSVNDKKGFRGFLSSKPQPYLSPGALTTCAAEVVPFSLLLLLLFFLLLILLFPPIRPSFLLSFRAERSGVEETFDAPDFRKTVRA